MEFDVLHGRNRLIKDAFHKPLLSNSISINAIEANASGDLRATSHSSRVQAEAFHQLPELDHGP